MTIWVRGHGRQTNAHRNSRSSTTLERRLHREPLTAQGQSCARAHTSLLRVETKQGDVLSLKLKRKTYPIQYKGNSHRAQPALQTLVCYITILADVTPVNWSSDIDPLLP